MGTLCRNHNQNLQPPTKSLTWTWVFVASLLPATWPGTLHPAEAGLWDAASPDEPEDPASAGRRTRLRGEPVTPGTVDCAGGG